MDMIRRLLDQCAVNTPGAELAARGESRSGPACVLGSVASLSKLARISFNTASFRRLGTEPMPRRMPARDFRHGLLARR
jgi:hypothetical protein